jgi:hypothetical protein
LFPNFFSHPPLSPRTTLSRNSLGNPRKERFHSTFAPHLDHISRTPGLPHGSVLCYNTVVGPECLARTSSFAASHHVRGIPLGAKTLPISWGDQSPGLVWVLQSRVPAWARRFL